MRTRHYHVVSGDRGYMPDRNVTHRTKREATGDMVDWKRTCENDAWQAIVDMPDDERTELIAEHGGRLPRIFTGSAQEGLYEANYPTSLIGLEYIELRPCDEVDCLEELEDA